MAVQDGYCLGSSSQASLLSGGVSEEVDGQDMIIVLLANHQAAAATQILTAAIISNSSICNSYTT